MSLTGKISALSLLCILGLSITSCNDVKNFKPRPTSTPAINAQDPDITIPDAQDFKPATSEDAAPPLPPNAPVLFPDPAANVFGPPLVPFGGDGHEHRGNGDSDSESCDMRECKKDSDCHRKNSCTISSCHNSKCVYRPIPGCAFCNNANDCSPGPVCKTTTCDNNRCTYTPIEGCPSLLFITIMPVDVVIAQNATVQYDAIGFFSDGTTRDITTEVTWSSSDTTIATISNAIGTQGLAVGIQDGVTTISATLDGVMASTTLTVVIGCVTAPANLVSWWPGDLNANDIADSNNGIFNGSYVPGEVKEAFSGFNTTTYVTVPRNQNLQPQTLTVDAWVNGPTSTAYETYILDQGNAPDCSGGASYALYTNYPGPAGITFYISDGTNFYKAVAPDFSWDGNWHFVAGTYDGASVNLYVDGNLVASEGAAVIINYDLYDNNFYIGHYPQCSDAAFAGAIDEVEVYDRALTLAEIQSIYNAKNAGKCKPIQ